MQAKVEEKWLDAGPHQFMTETCSSCRSFSPSMEAMPFQLPSSVSMCRQMEPCSLPASAGIFLPHFHRCLWFFFFPDMYPPRSSSHCHYFLPFPAWPLPPCCALLLGTCFPDPCCIQQREERWGENPTSRGERLWTDCYRNRQKPSGLASCLCRFNGNFGSNTDRTL